MTGHLAIPWAKPQFWGHEEKYVCEALRSSWISGGPFVSRLEEGFARFNGARFALATSNGTTALHLAYLSLDLKEGDEIITPGFAFMAGANIALHVGAVPVFADVDPHTWCLDPKDVERRISPRTKAILPVHTYGNVCAMDALMDLSASRDIPIIEDAAEALGSSFKGRAAGSIGKLGTYSLHATKTITTGEGGVVVTDDAELREKMWLYRSHGMGQTRYWHEVRGHNFRLTNLQAAIGCAQLEQIEHIVAARRAMMRAYIRCLDIGGVKMQVFAADVDPVIWVIAVKLDPEAFPQGRDAVMQSLLAAGVETRPGFYTATRMHHLYSAIDLPNSEAISDWVIALPSFPSLTEEQINFICTQLRNSRR